METSLPTPTTARVYVNLPEGNILASFFLERNLSLYDSEDIHVTSYNMAIYHVTYMAVYISWGTLQDIHV